MTPYLKPYKARCTKKVAKDYIKNRHDRPWQFSEIWYDTYVSGCLMHDVCLFYYKLGFKYKPAFPAKLEECDSLLNKLN